MVFEACYFLKFKLSLFVFENESEIEPLLEAKIIFNLIQFDQEIKIIQYGTSTVLEDCIREKSRIH